jgi:hypothetical protein
MATASRIWSRHVVEQDHLGAGGEGFFELAEVLDLDFDEHVGRGDRALSITALMPAAMMWFSLIRMPS